MAYAMFDKPVPKNLYANMPVLLCEYAHCMGNSLGNFSEFTEAFERYQHMCGGFIWDFADQAIRLKDGERGIWLYGDDFPEAWRREGYKRKSRTGSDGCFCGNGIAAADRTVHPAAYEVKKCYQTLRVEAVEGSETTYRICNRHMFSGLEAFTLSWSIAGDGIVLEEGEISRDTLAAIGPGQCAEINIKPAQHLAECPCDIITITFSWRHAQKNSWADAGYEQAFDQYTFRIGNELKKMQNSGFALNIPADRHETRRETAREPVCRFHFNRGILSSITMKSGEERHELLLNAVQPNLWRALTDNDIGMANFAHFLRPFIHGSRWEQAADKQRVSRWAVYTEEHGAWHKCGTVSGIYPDENSCKTTVYRVHTEWKHPLCRTLTTDYTVYPELQAADSEQSDRAFPVHGGLLISLHVCSKRIEPVRAGIQLILPEEFDEIEWIGRGPHECYPDRKTSARYGLYRCNVNELGHKYLRPQENGSRCDVNRLEIRSRNKSKITIQDAGGAGLLFSAWHYSQKALSQATHIHTLKTEALTVLNLDTAMCGVGGDIPGIAALHEAYRLKKNTPYTANILLTVSAEQ
jgi:beta-galactosidase